jgi:hypothetical protein
MTIAIEEWVSKNDKGTQSRNAQDAVLMTRADHHRKGCMARTCID